MISALFHAAGWAWEHVLEMLWRSDHGGKSLEKEVPSNTALSWAKVWPFLLATAVVVLYLAVILKLGGMEL